MLTSLGAVSISEITFELEIVLAWFFAPKTNEVLCVG